MTNAPQKTRRDALKLAAVGVLGASLMSVSRATAAAESTTTAVGSRGKRGLKLGVASYSLNKLSVEELIAALKQLEISYVSLYRSHAPWGGTVEECRAVRQKFKDAGITITGSGVIALPNDESAVRKAFDNARAAGMPTIVCKPALDAYPLLDRMVKEYDVKLAIHNHGPEDKVYASPLDVWKVIQPYDQRIGLCIDVGHSARAGTDPIAAIRTCRARLYDVHLKDTIAEAGATKDTPVEIGRGKLNIRGILATLREINYQSIVAIEYEKGGGDNLVGLAESVGFVRGLLAGMEN